MIVLLSASYPFGNGESFLHNEILELSKRGEQIIIFPFDTTGKLNYDLPTNVIVRKLTFVGNRKSEMICKAPFLAIRCFADPIFWEDIRDIIRDGFSVKKFLQTFKTISIAKFYADKIKSNLGTIDSDLKIRVFYSYWMCSQAMTGVYLKKQFRKARLVTRCHGYDLYRERSETHFLPCRRAIFRNADRIVTISRNGIDYLINTYPYIKKRKLRLSYLGTMDYGEQNHNVSNLFHIVSCSSLVPVKRVDILVAALSKITDIPFKWTHYGDGTEAEKIKNLAEKSIHNNVEYKFAGHVANTELMNIYKNSYISLFINVSSSEGLPVSIMEAMSFGIPVIATDVGGTSEIVYDGRNGYLMPKDLKADELADKIRYIMNMKSNEYLALRKNARNIWEKKFSAEKNYNRFFDGILMG